MARSYNHERNMEANQARRMHAEHRFLVRLEKRQALAERMVGQLCRDGKTVYYVFPDGGKYRESDCEFKLTDFLIRNRYV